MSDAGMDLVLDYLVHIRTEIKGLFADIQKTRERISAVEVQMGGIRRDVLDTATSIATISATLDRIDDRLARIEKQ